MKKIIAAFLAAALLAGCGGASKSASATDAVTSNYAVGGDSAPISEKASAADTNTSTSGSDTEITTADSTKKIVYTGSLTVETLDYDASMAKIQAMADAGKITIASTYEYTSGTLRSGSLTLRVPSDQFSDFMASAQDLGNVTGRSTNREDITKQYNDKSISIQALETEDARLQDMMKQATTVEDMIAIESRLSEVETQLNQYRSDLANMDTDVAMSTVNLQLNEVVEYSGSEQVRKDSTFLDRLANALSDSWKYFGKLLENLLFFAIYLIPVALLAGAVFLIVFAWRRKHPAKPKAPKNSQPVPQPETPAPAEKPQKPNDKA